MKDIIIICLLMIVVYLGYKLYIAEEKSGDPVDVVKSVSKEVVENVQKSEKLKKDIKTIATKIEGEKKTLIESATKQDVAEEKIKSIEAKLKTVSTERDAIKLEKEKMVAEKEKLAADIAKVNSRNKLLELAEQKVDKEKNAVIAEMEKKMGEVSVKLAKARALSDKNLMELEKKTDMMNMLDEKSKDEINTLKSSYESQLKSAREICKEDIFNHNKQSEMRCKDKLSDADEKFKDAQAELQNAKKNTDREVATIKLYEAELEKSRAKVDKLSEEMQNEKIKTMEKAEELTRKASEEKRVADRKNREIKDLFVTRKDGHNLVTRDGVSCPSETYDTIKNSTPDACELSCLTDRRCDVATFRKSTKECKLGQYDYSEPTQTCNKDADYLTKFNQYFTPKFA